MEPESRGNSEIHFLLPGFSAAPIGGYRVVYDYANALASRARYAVHLHHSRSFFAEPGLNPLRHVALRSTKSAMLGKASALRAARIPWMPLHPRIRVHHSVSSPRIQLRHQRAAIVATNVHTAAFLARVAPRFPQASRAYFIQGRESWAGEANAIDRVWALPLRRIVVAPWLQDQLTARNLSSHLLPNPINPGRFPPGPPLNARPMRVGALASEAPVKRLDVLIRTFTLTHRARPEIEHCAFGVGPRPRQLPHFVNYIRNPKPALLADFYASLRVFLCTSDSEGWGLTPAEATLAGAAVVSTLNGGVEAYARDFASFAPVGDFEALASHILGILDSENRAQERVDAGRLALTAYSVDDATDELLKILFRASHDPISD